MKADFIIFLSSSETVLVQVHLDTPQTDLDVRGAGEGAGSVPDVLCLRKMFNLMICIKILLMVESLARSAHPGFRTSAVCVFG
ncbi:hypothetical protein EJA70_19120 [Pseudomonas sp. PB103]|uniref:hypothetical protein n=1 Tax=Pseudomonas sp. PB103 TaxID=2494698 RepID=UPI00131C71F2|nr:hypothetical protein [Pseudomonas sp. PB103]KAE9642355.1 hypothetical protein EJA70_19120 [Pseudomonas sp. PB103]